MSHHTISLSIEISSQICLTTLCLWPRQNCIKYGLLKNHTLKKVFDTYNN